ncbi:MAG: beta-propeller fold lactonase family protein [Gemmatimonadaceae bacterium]
MRFALPGATAVALLALAACADQPTPLAPSSDITASAARSGANGRHGKVAGAVYSMSNDPAGNHVVAYRRFESGHLDRLESYPTGGTGSGGFEDTANGMILGNARGESSPNNLNESEKFLFVTNAGSNSITVFKVMPKGGLKLVEVQPSGGEKPVSVTVNHGLLYVLHSGEFMDGEITTPNCTTGNLPSVTGFRVSANGHLEPIPNSTRHLSEDHHSGCAQVSFTPNGRVLVVTERLAGDEDPTSAAGDEGYIVTFVVKEDGRLGQRRITDATGQGPFGFTFNKQGALFTTEQFDGSMGPNQGAAAGYMVNDDGTLTPASPSVHNGGTDTCWFVITDDGKYGFATSFFGDGRISSYLVKPNGGLELLNATANTDQVDQGASDISLSEDSRYLYQLNSFKGTINVFRVGNDGGLTYLETVQAQAPSPLAAPLGISAF